MFTSEEPTRFALGCIGSRGLAGALTADTLQHKTDENYTTFMEVSTLTPVNTALCMNNTRTVRHTAQ